MPVTAYPGVVHKRWTPAQLSTVAVWLKADEITGMNDGDPLPQWSDSSGNLRHFVQATVAKQPVYVASGIGGKPGVRFDGVDDTLRHAGTLADQSGAVFAVVQPLANGAWTVISSADEALTSSFFIPIFKTTAHTLGMQPASSDVIHGDTVLTNGQNFVLESVCDGTTNTLFTNGNDETETVVAGTNSGGWFGDVAGRDSISIGALKRSTESSFANAIVSEILIVSGTLTTATRAAIRRYLANKHAITLVA